jgi:hypothetical protein
MDKPNPPKPATIDDRAYYRVTFARFVVRDGSNYRPRNAYVLKGALVRELDDAIATAVMAPSPAIG